MSTRDGDRLLTTAEAAAMLRVSPRTIQKLAANRELACVRPGGRKVYFQQGDVVDYLARTRQATA